MIGHILVAAVIIVIVAAVAFTFGAWYGIGSNAELIGELERELDARKAEPPAELAHEPDEVLGEPENVEAPATPPTGFLAVPDWHADDEALDEWVAGRSAELRAAVAAMIEDSEHAA